MGALSATREGIACGQIALYFEAEEDKVEGSRITLSTRYLYQLAYERTADDGTYVPSSAVCCC